MDDKNITPSKVNVASEYGRLRAVLLHRPGVEIERMTPLNAAHALYSDILNKPIVDTADSNFCGVLDRWAQVYYVEDILERLLDDADIRRRLRDADVVNGDTPVIRGIQIKLVGTRP